MVLSIFCCSHEYSYHYVYDYSYDHYCYCYCCWSLLFLCFAVGTITLRTTILIEIATTAIFTFVTRQNSCYQYHYCHTHKRAQHLTCFSITTIFTLCRELRAAVCEQDFANLGNLSPRRFRVFFGLGFWVGRAPRVRFTCLGLGYSLAS